MEQVTKIQSFKWAVLGSRIYIDFLQGAFGCQSKACSFDHSSWVDSEKSWDIFTPKSISKTTMDKNNQVGQSFVDFSINNERYCKEHKY